MAANLRHPGGPPERPGPRHPLRQHSEEEVGRQLGLHGPLRLRRRGPLLGHLGLQDVLRREAPPLLGQSRPRSWAEVPDRAGGASRHRPPLPQRGGGDGHGDAVLPHGVDGVVPVRVRRHNANPGGGVVAGEDEYQGVDDVCAALADVFLHGGGVQSLGRRFSVPLGGD